jgi:hypothetical protein
MRTAGGLVLLVAGVVIVLPLPEFGLPLILAALRLLGERFAWARRANEWIDLRYARLRERFDRLPVAGKALALLIPLALAGALVWLLLSHG